MKKNQKKSKIFSAPLSPDLTFDSFYDNKQSVNKTITNDSIMDAINSGFNYLFIGVALIILSQLINLITTNPNDDKPEVNDKIHLTFSFARVNTYTIIPISIASIVIVLGICKILLSYKQGRSENNSDFVKNNEISIKNVRSQKKTWKKHYFSNFFSTTIIGAEKKALDTKGDKIKNRECSILLDDLQINELNNKTQTGEKNRCFSPSDDNSKKTKKEKNKKSSKAAFFKSETEKDNSLPNLYKGRYYSIDGRGSNKVSSVIIPKNVKLSQKVVNLSKLDIEWVRDAAENHGIKNRGIGIKPITTLKGSMPIRVTLQFDDGKEVKAKLTHEIHDGSKSERIYCCQYNRELITAFKSDAMHSSAAQNRVALLADNCVIKLENKNDLNNIMSNKN